MIGGSLVLEVGSMPANACIRLISIQRVRIIVYLYALDNELNGENMNGSFLGG